MNKTTIHQIGLDACLICGEDIPPGHVAQSGEYVGVITYGAGLPANSYRVGENNRDRLCNGNPSFTFSQASRKGERV